VQPDDIDRFIRARIGGLPVACAKGCHWCCHQLVVITCRDDGRRILAAARARFTVAEFESFEAAVREQDAAIGRLGHEAAQALRWPCPLLRDGLCAVYDVRPVACRSVVSPDPDCCREMMEAESFEDLSPKHQALATQIGALAFELQVAVNDSRPVDGPVELRQLLRELLDGERAAAG
jgi:Fe-S-cluster containining protein